MATRSKVNLDVSKHFYISHKCSHVSLTDHTYTGNNFSNRPTPSNYYPLQDWKFNIAYNDNLHTTLCMSVKWLKFKWRTKTHTHTHAMAQQPNVGQSCFILEVSRSHKMRHHSPLDEESAHPKDLYLTTHNTHKRQDIHAPGGIRTRKPRQPQSSP
jgi:hypothetical protein